jgi:hypothetical protein
VAFSDAVAGAIAARLRAGPESARWVALPQWRAGVAEEVGASVAVEDLNQSNRALNRLAAEKRQQARAGGREDVRRR